MTTYILTYIIFSMEIRMLSRVLVFIHLCCDTFCDFGSVLHLKTSSYAIAVHIVFTYHLLHTEVTSTVTTNSYILNKKKFKTSSTIDSSKNCVKIKNNFFSVIFIQDKRVVLGTVEVSYLKNTSF